MDKKIREFQKEDYRTFPGVEDFADGSAPLISYDIKLNDWDCDELVIVADANGMEIQGSDCDFIILNLPNRKKDCERIANRILKGNCTRKKLLERYGWEIV